MPRLANVSGYAGLAPIRSPLPDGNRAFLFPLVVDDVDQQPVDRDRVGAEHHALGIKTITPLGRERTALPYASQAVHDLEHGLRAQRFYGRERADKRIRMRLRSHMRASYIGKIAVRDVLETSGHARRAVVFHVGHVDDLGESLGHQPDKVRARVFLAEEIHLHVSARIVAEHAATRRFHGNNVDALRNMTLVMHALQLIQEALIDVDLFRLDSHDAEVTYDLAHYFRSRHDVGRARAVHFDTHYIIRTDEARPGIAN